MNMQSLGVQFNDQNSLDYYSHPDVINDFSKTLDLYTLGVVLLEIAIWRALASNIPKDTTLLGSIHKIFVGTAGQSLDAVVGSVYAGVVRTCLQYKLPDPNLGAEFACAVNTGIVLPLERCFA
jgi:hypothetical protein